MNRRGFLRAIAAVPFAAAAAVKAPRLVTAHLRVNDKVTPALKSLDQEITERAARELALAEDRALRAAAEALTPEPWIVSGWVSTSVHPDDVELVTCDSIKQAADRLPAAHPNCRCVSHLGDGEHPYYVTLRDLDIDDDQLQAVADELLDRYREYEERILLRPRQEISFDLRWVGEEDEWLGS